MDGALIAALSALGVSSIGFVGTLISKKTRGPEDQAVTRRDTIADRDAWITTLNDRIDKLDTRLQAAENEIKEVRTLNEKLKAALYRALGILREHELLHLLKPGDVPDDIHY